MARAGGGRRKGGREDAPTRRQRPDLGRESNELRARLAPHLQDALDALIPHERRIVESLRDPEQAERFFRDPAAALEHAGIELSPLLRKQLAKARGSAEALLGARAFRLPTGQVVHPRIRIRFGPRRERES
jgi:hypothetical protein